MIDDEREWYIYVLKDPRDGEVRYVGFTIDIKRRYRNHITSSQREKTYKANWIRSVLRAGFKPALEIIESGYGDWQEREAHWIEYYRSIGARLTNATNGGDGTPGYVMSDEAKAKLRRGALGRVISIEQREKLRIANMGKVHPPSVREKISAGNKGKIRTPEMLEKYKLAQAPKRVGILRVDDGVYFESVQNAAAAVGASHSSIQQAVISGGTCFGYKWAYADPDYQRKTTSDVTRNKLSISSRGRRLSQSTILRMRENNQSKRRVIRVNDGMIFQSLSDAARFMEVTHAAIFTAIQRKYQCRGYLWRYEDDTDWQMPDTIGYQGGNNRISVIRVEDGVVFNSASEAGTSVGRHSGGIIKAIKRGGKCGGYHWKYADQPPKDE